MRHETSHASCTAWANAPINWCALGHTSTDWPPRRVSIAYWVRKRSQGAQERSTKVARSARAARERRSSHKAQEQSGSAGATKKRSSNVETQKQPGSTKVATQRKINLGKQEQPRNAGAFGNRTSSQETQEQRECAGAARKRRCNQRPPSTWPNARSSVLTAILAMIQLCGNYAPRTSPYVCTAWADHPINWCALEHTSADWLRWGFPYCLSIKVQTP